MSDDKAPSASITACTHARQLHRLVDEIVFLVGLLSAPALKVGEAEQIAALHAEAERIESIDALLAQVLRDRASRLFGRSPGAATQRADGIRLS